MWGQCRDCEFCGVTVLAAKYDEHDCDPDQLKAHQARQSKHEADQLEAEFASYLETSAGRFDAWYAERRRTA